jgi:hypothetical protein
MGFDIISPVVGKTASYVFKPEALYNIKQYALHPNYKTYYHGSPEKFNMRDARTGSWMNIGLHVGEDRAIAN